LSVIKSRLRRLEEYMRGGRCPECGLRPQDNGYMVVDDNDPARHIPEVCPECGRSTKIHIRVVYEGEEGEGRKL
jgi:rRNA maturation protein Nop10